MVEAASLEAERVEAVLFGWEVLVVSRDEGSHRQHHQASFSHLQELDSKMWLLNLLLLMRLLLLLRRRRLLLSLRLLPSCTSYVAGLEILEESPVEAL